MTIGTNLKLNDTGDLFTFDEFKGMCDSGALIDYDGMGVWATETHHDDSGNWIYPSQIKKGMKAPKGFTHVEWYNK